MSIPKIIHYCWFGHGEKSELMKHCMETWRKYCPDWQIIEWNEDNFDVNFCPYASKAYNEKRYGFLADAARLKIIFEHGGVYLDTDVELKCSLDELLDNEAWFGYGQETEINTGSGFGAVKGNWLVEKLLEQYLTFTAEQPFEVCTKVDTQVFQQHFPNYAANYTVRQEYNGILILDNIWHYVIHHYTGTWMTKRQRFVTKLANLLPSKVRAKLIALKRKMKK
jgi:hypothetical protein